MPDYADVDDQGVCVNVIVADESFRPLFAQAFPDHRMIGPLDDLDPIPGIGWTFDGTNWTAPVTPEPRDS